MLKSLRDFLQQVPAFADSSHRADDTELVRLAAAALLVEAMQADHEVQPDEREAVIAALRQQFGLAQGDAERLFHTAEERVRDAVSLHEFTALLHKALTPAEKFTLLEQIWRVVLADNRLDKYEEHLVRRIADLLYLSHHDFIRAKLRAQGEI